MPDALSNCRVTKIYSYLSSQRGVDLNSKHFCSCSLARVLKGLKNVGEKIPPFQTKVGNLKFARVMQFLTTKVILFTESPLLPNIGTDAIFMPTLLAHEDESGLQRLDQSNVIAISGFDIRPGASGVCSTHFWIQARVLKVLFIKRRKRKRQKASFSWSLKPK